MTTREQLARAVLGAGARALAFAKAHRTFILLFFSYFYFFQGGDPNQSSRLLLTRAIVERHALDITPDHAISLDKGFHNGKFYSDKAPGTSFAAVAPYAVLYATDRVLGTDPHDRIASRAKLHLLVALLAGLPTTIIAYLIFRTLGALGIRRGVAELSAFAYGVGTIAFPFATVMFGHQLATLLVFGSFAWMALARRKQDAPTTRNAILLGLTWGASIVIEYPTGMLCAMLGLYFLTWVPRSLRAIAKASALVTLGALGPLALHSIFLYGAYGSPFTLPYKYLIEPIFTTGTSGGFLGIGVPTRVGIYGTLVSPYRGVLFFSPFLAFAIAGIVTWLTKSNGSRKEALCALASIAIYLVFNTSYYAWDGGGSFGPRHLLPVMPYVVMCVGMFANEHRAQLALVVLALVPSVFIMLIGTAVLVQLPEGDAYRMNPLYEVFEAALARGELAINPQDSFVPELRGDAAYNLGSMMGLGPLLSIAALVVIWILVETPRLLAPKEA